MIKAVIFDMDGVLIDSEPVYLQSLRQFLIDHDVTFDEEKLKKTVGSSVAKTDEIMYSFFSEGTDFTAFQEEFHTIMFPPIDYKAIQNKGIKETLEEIKQRGIKLAIASSSPIEIIEKVCEELKIRSYFDSLLSGEMFHESKPHPEIYIKSAELLEVKPEECLVVEDSTYGIMAGKAAGMKVLAKQDHMFGMCQEQADDFIQELPDMIAHL